MMVGSRRKRKKAIGESWVTMTAEKPIRRAKPENIGTGEDPPPQGAGDRRSRGCGESRCPGRESRRLPVEPGRQG
jgi:hypothetical protein